MPIYEYKCPSCRALFEEWVKTHDTSPQPCPDCGALSPHIVSNTTFVLKGGGWYVTEYGNRKSANEAAPSASASSESASSGGTSSGAATSGSTLPESTASTASAPSGAKSEKASGTPSAAPVTKDAAVSAA